MWLNVNSVKAQRVLGLQKNLRQRLTAPVSRLLAAGLNQSTTGAATIATSSPRRSDDDAAAEQVLPGNADVVVVGGGSVGCSTAYHLAKMGAGKVLLLEKHSLTAGTTWHSAGLLWSMHGHDHDFHLVSQTRDLMTHQLKEECGAETGWITTGGIFSASSEKRMDLLQGMHSLGKMFGIPSHVLSTPDLVDLYPLADPNLLVGGLYSPLDGNIDPTSACNAYVKAAKHFGAQVYEGCEVRDIIKKQDHMGLERVAAIETNLGRVETDVIINCSGAWAPYIGKMAGVRVPQTSFKHAYVVTTEVEGIQTLPNMRYLDGSIYLKRQGNVIQIGGYEANPIYMTEVEKDFAFGLYDLDWNAFGHHLDRACELLPILETCGVQTTVCGPESFTADGHPLLGEAAEVRGFIHGSGFNSGGMMLGGGAGRQLAHWALRGRPEFDLFAYDVKRFPSTFASDKTWLKERSHEMYAKHYAIAFPNDQPLAARNTRVNLLNDVLTERGCFIQDVKGVERPSYFMPGSALGVKEYDYYGHSSSREQHQDYEYRDFLTKEYTFDYPEEIHQQVAREALTCRTSAVVFNTSSMGKFVLRGPDATRAARALFTRDVTAHVDRCTYTLLLNDAGGIEADLVVAKLGDDPLDGAEYFMTVGGGAAEYCRAYIQQQLADLKLNCEFHDKTADNSILSIQGPASLAFLQATCPDDRIAELKYGRMVATEIYGTPVRVMRLSFVGELGYEVHCSSAAAPFIYQAIMDKSAAYGVCDAGYRALSSLSMEAGFHHWSHTIRGDDTPQEAHLSFLCAAAKRNYVGKRATLAARDSPPAKVAAFFCVDNSPVPFFGHELIRRDGHVVGYTRAAATGFSLEKEIAFGYVELAREDGTRDSHDPADVESSTYTLERQGVEYPAVCSVNSVFDPSRSRMFRGLYDESEQDVLGALLGKYQLPAEIRGKTVI